MGFERIVLAIGKTKAPAGISITGRGKTVIAIRSDFVAKAGFKSDGRFSVLLGSDDDAGKLRIIKDRDHGVPCARELKRTGAFFFNLGIVPRVGVSPRRQRPAEARAIENGIEIDIPADDGPKLLPAPAKTPGAGAAKPPPAAARNAGGEAVGDVTINLTDGEEAITFKGKTIAVSAREAKFLKILARPRPNPVGLSFIVDKLWDGKPPGSAMIMVSALAADLKMSLPSIGLTVNHVKGTGYQLRDV